MEIEMPVEDRINLFVKTRGPISRTNILAKSPFREDDYLKYNQRYHELVVENGGNGSCLIGKEGEIALRAYMAL